MKKQWSFILATLIVAMLFMVIGGCGGGADSGSTNSSTGATFAISGTVTQSGVGLAGVLVTLSGSSSASKITDSNGNYSFSGLASANFIISPTKSGYTFNPASKSITINGANTTDVGFTASTSTTAVPATITDSNTGMVLLKVTGGTYTMGDTFGDGESNEKPTHQVTVGDFYIGKYEVTQGQWQAVMGSKPSCFTTCGANCPVENVSWNDIQSFITTLNQRSGKSYRLPTEAEWEYAARSGGQSQKYSGSSEANAVAWYGDNSGGITHTVGSKQANGLGLYDMSGNVAEWVGDRYGAYGGSAQTNPTGPFTGTDRVIRGGGCFGSAISASYRDGSTPLFRAGYIGFRLAASVH